MDKQLGVQITIFRFGLRVVTNIIIPSRWMELQSFFFTDFFKVVHGIEFGALERLS